VRRLGLTDVCDSVVLSFEVGAKKPDPEIYREALARVGNPAPGSVVFVDDQERYCDGARALGMQTRLIVRGLGPDPIEGSPAGWGDHPVITELRSLLE
jgi:putative hydrolase of the HAD superfamily